jgi:4-alpha-glucanotransferase
MRKHAGIMVPLFSVPGKYGIGDIDSMYKLIDKVKHTGISVMQLLPMNAVAGDETSPYSSISSFAFNPVYISLARISYLEHQIPEPIPTGDRVDYVTANEIKYAFLKKAYSSFLKNASALDLKHFEEFCEKQNEWLEPYAVFHALAASNNSAFWDWDKDLQTLNGAMGWAKENESSVNFYKFCQWLMFEQWQELKQYAADAGISFMGDLPLYVSKNSSDHWAKPELFKKGVHAGVPPDIYAEDGQDWGNPIYNWEMMAKDGFTWWKKRLLWLGEFFDLVRVDHFRGLYSYWEVTDGKSPKETEDWTTGPQTPLIDALKETGVTLIGEDLGDIPDEVDQWIQETEVPGYKVFLFGWGHYRSEKYRWPENYPRNSLACTSTHDSESFVEFLNAMEDPYVYELAAYLGIREEEQFTLTTLLDRSIQKLLSSNSRYVIIPLQDILNIGVRINTPGTVGSKNWTAVIPVTSENEARINAFAD